VVDTTKAGVALESADAICVSGNTYTFAVCTGGLIATVGSRALLASGRIERERDTLEVRALPCPTNLEQALLGAWA
jgi:hypothetical protein